MEGYKALEILSLEGYLSYEVHSIFQYQDVRYHFPVSDMQDLEYIFIIFSYERNRYKKKLSNFAKFQFLNEIFFGYYTKRSLLVLGN